MRYGREDSKCRGAFRFRSKLKRSFAWLVGRRSAFSYTTYTTYTTTTTTTTTGHTRIHTHTRIRSFVRSFFMPQDNTASDKQRQWDVSALARQKSDNARENLVSFNLEDMDATESTTSLGPRSDTVGLANPMRVSLSGAGSSTSSAFGNFGAQNVGHRGAPPMSSDASSRVVREFHEALARSSDMAVAVAAIHALTTVIRSSTSTTMMGLEREIKEGAQALQRYNPTAISLQTGCELFLRYTTRTSALEADSFEVAKRKLIERGRTFAETSKRARNIIAEHGERFVRPGSRILVHGHSRVALSVLERAAMNGQQFSVTVTEGRPDETGFTMAKVLTDLKIPTTIVLDSAVGYIMESMDMVLVGAEAVAESGGVVNKLGTYTVALSAKAHGVPVYCAAESYKFARLFPLSQRDLPRETKQFPVGPLLPESVRIDNPSRDYTPPAFVSLLFTDLGVLTPAAVSDELIQLYA